jgi:hypothetical protein
MPASISPDTEGIKINTRQDDSVNFVAVSHRVREGEEEKDCFDS